MNSAGKSEDLTRPTGRRSGAAPKAPPITRVARRLGRMIPEAELRQIPKDLSDQIDHYVYGTPKR